MGWEWGKSFPGRFPQIKLPNHPVRCRPQLCGAGINQIARNVSRDLKTGRISIPRSIQLWTALIILIVVFLVLISSKRRKINGAAVLTGAFGYLLIYVSRIRLSIQKGVLTPIILYGLAIILLVMLCGIGIQANLKNPKVYWGMEVSNVICQGLTAIAAVMMHVRR